MKEYIELDELLKGVIDSLYLCVVVDDRGAIRYLSKSYAEILGVDDLTVVGTPIKQVIFNTGLLRVMETGRDEVGKVFFMKNGEPVICNRIPIRDKKGRVRGALSTATFQNLNTVERLNVEIEKLRRENNLYQEQLKTMRHVPFSLDSVIGDSPVMQSVKNTISKVANSDLSVLITGETGTGKEVFANAIHQLSVRRFGPFVKINCAAIPKELLEAELFGYAEGAFSGAAKGGKTGKFQQADNGTILLDEICEMPHYLQSKLLRVLQERELEPVGSLKTVKLNVRVICNTNQDIQKMVAEGSFRQDLYYRINVVEMTIPPLRERREDLPALCDFLLKKINHYHGCAITGVTPAVLGIFEKYDWPGNVRELEHTLERAGVSAPAGLLDMEHFDFFLPRVFKQSDIHEMQKGEPNALCEQKARAEREAIVYALIKAKGNKAQTARDLNIPRSLLYEKIKRYQI